MAAISSPPATTAQGTAAALAPSALSRLCGGLMEAVWLTAVAALPCLFNPYSQDNFGPEKQRLLHILGLTMATAWIVRSVEDRLGLGGVKNRLRELSQRPAAWFLVALTLSYLTAACLSVEPVRSWWGDFQGSGFAACTFLSHLVLLAAMAAHLRHRDQAERFATAVLVGSVPVCLYGLLQRAGFDPIKWSWGRDEISSLLGHQIYVAAYLGMVFPLCLRRIIQIARDLRKESGGNTQKTGTSRPRGIPVRSAARPKPGVETTRRLKMAALAVYCLLAILQLGTFLLAEKRGPLLGLVASLVSFFALLSVCWGLRRLLLWTIAAGGAAGILLVLLNISGGPLERLRSVPVLKEFSHGLFSTHDASGYFRANLWKECPVLMLSGDALRRPDGSADGLHALRQWLGYGPDTTTGVLAQRFTVPHSAATLEDHFHNLVWELWETLGGFGVVSFLGFFASLIYSGVRRLDLITGPADKIIFWTVTVVAALSGATVLGLWQGAGFCGLGLQIGMAAGCGVYPLIKVFSGDASVPVEASSGPTSVLLIALLAAMLMHLVETAFAFPTPATSVLFWTYAGLLLSLDFRDAPAGDGPRIRPGSQQELAREGGQLSSNAPIHSDALRVPMGRDSRSGGGARMRGSPSGISQKSSPFWSALLPAILTTIILLPLINMFFLRYTHDGLSGLDFVSFALGQSHLDSGARNLVPELLLAVWFGTTFLLTADRVITGNGAGWAGQFFAALLLSAGAAGVYALWNAAQLAAIGPLPRGLAEGASFISQAQGYEAMSLAWMGITLGLILAGGFACCKLASERCPQAVSRPAKSSLAGLVVAVVVLAGSLVLAWRVDFRSARADACSRWAEVMQSQKVWPAANDVFDRAIQLCPAEFIYRSRFALALREQAEAARDDAVSSRLMQQAQHVLEQSKSLAGYNRRDWHTAQLYMAWAMRETNQVRLTELAQRAKDTFKQALLWEPWNPPLWSDCAFVDLFLLHQEEDGLRENQKALEIDPTCEQALGRLGDFYGQKSKQASDAAAKRQYASDAVKYYRLATDNTGAPFAFLMAAGRLTLGLGDAKQAVDDFARASKAAPTDEVWKSEEMLARSYLALTNKAATLEHLERAIAGAGPEQKPALLELEKQVERSRR